MQSIRSTKPAANWAERREPVTLYLRETVVLILSLDVRKMCPPPVMVAGIFFCGIGCRTEPSLRAKSRNPPLRKRDRQAWILRLCAG